MDTLIQKIQEKSSKFNELYLDNIVLCKSEYNAIFNFYSKNVYPQEDKELLKEIISQIIPKNIKIKDINYSKIYCDEEIAQNETEKIISDNFPSLGAAIKKITCRKDKQAYVISIECLENIQTYAENSSAGDKIKTLMHERFMENFEIKVNYIQSNEKTDEAAAAANVYVAAPAPVSQRFIEVKNVAPLVGRYLSTTAQYIADCEEEAAQAIICGKVKNYNERITKNEKVIISFVLEDFTASITCIMFPAQNYIEKVKQLSEGGEVILFGELIMDTYRNCIVFKTRYISFCELPQDFVMKERLSKPEPENYNIVQPQKLELASQVDIFQSVKKEVSDFFLNKCFIVFDIETTGLNYDTDKITEIGAIKIENGIITHSFSTLINPKIHIRDETVKLNGINDELVKDSPVIEDVLPDFYKFTRDCFLVAQNIDFDLKFIKYNAKKIGYYFENKFYDTLQIAREKLADKGLSNFKLDTLCKYFNIDLTDHHRAWNDALATAKLFIELKNIKD